MTSRDRKLTFFSENVPFLHMIAWYKYELISTKQTEIIENFVFLFYMVYIGNFTRWFQNMAKNLCSSQGIPPKIGQNVLKGYKLKVIKLGGA